MTDRQQMLEELGNDAEIREQYDSAVGEVWPYLAMAVILIIGLASWAVGVFG